MDKKEKGPDVALVLHGDGPKDEPEEGGDDGGDDAALHKAGSAVMKAYSEGDPVALAKAVAACAKMAPDGDDEDGGDMPEASLGM